MNMLRKYRHLRRWGTLGALALAAVVVVAWSGTQAAPKAQEGEDFGPPDPDDHVSAVVVTPGSTSEGATTTYSVQLTLADAVPADTSVRLEFRDMSCDRGFEFNRVTATVNRCEFDLSNATSSTHTITVSADDNRSVVVEFPSGQSAGTFTVQLANIVNPTQSGSFAVGATSYLPDEEPEEFKQTVSDTFFMGTVIVTGTVTDPDGVPVPYAGVDFYNENWTVHSWASTD
ncbi:MAG: hypothetical protein HYZ08_01810, partial [Candidatus Kerfeldbacteria bacterium]|nr:hypothetical protein [Candidatus Kerfeldbacteria bacterium]